MIAARAFENRRMSASTIGWFGAAGLAAVGMTLVCLHGCSSGCDEETANTRQLRGCLDETSAQGRRRGKVCACRRMTLLAKTCYRRAASNASLMTTS
jgi:hypothetical protein